MPRRYWSYLPEYQTLHIISTVGSWILIIGLILMFWNLLYAVFKGEKASANPWGGTTLEWQIQSPPIMENFHEIPTITHEPYYHATAIDIDNNHNKIDEGKNE